MGFINFLGEYHQKQEKRKRDLFESSPQYIKREAAKDVLINAIPKDGNTLLVYGGLGNKNICQIKNEQGKFYRKDNKDGIKENDVWTEFNMFENIKKFIRE
jgi:hypothetical protein